MRRQIGRTFGTMVAFGVLLAGCSDRAAPTHPLTTESFFAEAPRPGFDVMKRTIALRSAISVTETVGPAGATITLPGAGLALHFPPGALDIELEVTLTAHAGRDVAFEFQPHGIRFARPVTVSIDVTGTTAEARFAGSQAALREREGGDSGSIPLDDYVGVYFSGEPTTGPVRVLEVLPMTFTGNRLLFQIDHFSGYASASG